MSAISATAVAIGAEPPWARRTPCASTSFGKRPRRVPAVWTASRRREPTSCAGAKGAVLHDVMSTSNSSARPSGSTARASPSSGATTTSANDRKTNRTK